MRREITLGIGAEPEEVPAYEAACEASEIQFAREQDGSFTHLKFEIAGDDPRYETLLDELASRKILYIGWNENRRYTKKELEESEFLELQTSTQIEVPEINFEKSRFDFSSACRNCNAGVKRVVPLRFDFSKMKSKQITQTHEHSLVISESLRTLIEDAALAGISWAACEHAGSRDHDMEPLYVMKALHELPKMHKATRLKTNADCRKCKNSGIVPMSEIQYSRKAVGKLASLDLLRTHEFIGAGEGSHFAALNQVPVISQRFYRILKTHKVRHLGFEPIVLR